MHHLILCFDLLVPQLQHHDIHPTRHISQCGRTQRDPVAILEHELLEHELPVLARVTAVARLCDRRRVPDGREDI